MARAKQGDREQERQQVIAWLKDGTPEQWMDAQIAVRLMGYPASYTNHPTRPLRRLDMHDAYPPYSTDPEAVRQVEAALQARGLWDAYIRWLTESLYGYEAMAHLSIRTITEQDMRALDGATPMQRCGAAIQALNG
jgi:hypothetical protein